MKPPQHIPTIIGLLLLIISLGSTVFLVEQGQRFMTQANADAVPQEITISNISDTHFTVSWNTAKSARGTVSYGKKGETTFIALDDRDEITPQEYQTHHVTVRNLQPSTGYTFTVISDKTSYDNAGDVYQLQTAGIISPAEFLPPVYGAVTNTTDQPASGTLIYLTAGNSQVLSTIADSTGQFVLPIATIRNQSLTQSIAMTDDTIIQFDMRGIGNNTTRITTSLGDTHPLPAIVLGKGYNFLNQKETHTSSVVHTWSELVQTMKRAIISPAYAADTITITQPEPDAGVPSRTPLFKGTGVFGKQVIATVGNPVQTGKVWVDTDGAWSWSPQTPLLPDRYVLTITTFDEQDTAVALSRQFTVLKSGSSVLQAATPSATPIITATASPSAQPLPVSGNTSPTIAIILAGLVLLFTGTVTTATIRIRK